jgi:hypothetical protein
VPHHGIGQQVQRSSAGSIPHDRITILQICSSRSLPLDRPRQSASRHPPVVTNRPTSYRVRRDPRLIQHPFHHPSACWSASTPFTHVIRGTQIPIAQAATPTSPFRGFLPWRFAYAGPPVHAAPPSWGRHPQTFTRADPELLVPPTDTLQSEASSARARPVTALRLFGDTVKTRPLDRSIAHFDGDLVETSRIINCWSNVTSLGYRTASLLSANDFTLP